MVLPFELFPSVLADVPCLHPVGILAVAAGHTEKQRLGLSVVGAPYNSR